MRRKLWSRSKVQTLQGFATVKKVFQYGFPLRLERMEDRLTPALSVPVLNSFPGAAASLYLDFDGHFEASWGGYSNITTPAYDLDGNTSDFSAAELAAIETIWSRAAEDFAPFNINVTTVEPPELAPGMPSSAADKKAMRVSIGGDGMWYKNGGYGGVALINSFTSTSPNVCYVFAKPTSSLFWVGDTVSHEAGHTFGLLHQSRFDANGAEVMEYESGTTSWGPLMGSPFPTATTTWHNGPTTSATTFQDDMAILANSTNGFGYRTDDHGNTTSSATFLSPSGSTWAASGIISTNTDVDFFAFTVSTADTYRLHASGPGAIANLDAVLELRNSAGQVLEIANPSSAIDATIVRPLTPDNYTAAVKSSGAYGWVGSYTLTIDTPPAGIRVTPATSNLSTHEDGRTTSFAVQLETAPLANVVVPVSSSNPAEGTVTVSSLTFTPANWNIPQTVIITGVADGVIDSDTAYTIVLGAASSSDAEYQGLDAADLEVVNVANDDAGFRYYTTVGGDLNTINRSRLDGSHPEVILRLHETFGGLSRYSPRILRIDSSQGKIYWTDAGTSRIYRANRDGSSAEVILNLAALSPTGTALPTGLELDVARGKLYWTDSDSSGRGIRRANLDGTQVELVLATIGSPGNITLDAVAGKLYWNEFNNGSTSVRRANLDGSAPEDLMTFAGGTLGVHLDPLAGKIYLSQSTSGLIVRANLDGTGVEVLVNFKANNSNATVAAFSVDLAAGKMYWRQTEGNFRSLRRANLDGTNLAILNTSNESIWGMAFDRPGPGISVTGHIGLTTTEGGSGTSFRVVLTSQPTASVTIPVSSSDTTEGTVSVSSLTFTPGNWNVPQTVTLTSMEDTITDGNISYSIVLGNAISADPTYSGLKPSDVAVTNLDNDFNKFFVVDDASTNRNYRYGVDLNSRSNATLNSGNSAPRGAASTITGDKLWVVDANKKVYVYNTSSGSLLGSWSANSLPKSSSVEGITVWGNDVWIVDATSDKIYRYANAANRTSGSQNATSSFALHANNIGPKDLVTDGVHFWVVDNQVLDRVYKYTLSGTYVSRWDIDPANASPTGITLDPANPGHLWIVDNGTDRVYQYDYAMSRNSGSQLASISYALAAGNTNPQGIADPPASATSSAMFPTAVPTETNPSTTIDRVESEILPDMRSWSGIALPQAVPVFTGIEDQVRERGEDLYGVPNQPVRKTLAHNQADTGSTIADTAVPLAAGIAMIATDWLLADEFDFAPIEVALR